MKAEAMINFYCVSPALGIKVLTNRDSVDHHWFLNLQKGKSGPPQAPRNFGYFFIIYSIIFSVDIKFKIIV